MTFPGSGQPAEVVIGGQAVLRDALNSPSHIAQAEADLETRNLRREHRTQRHSRWFAMLMTILRVQK